MEAGYKPEMIQTMNLGSPKEVGHDNKKDAIYFIKYDKHKVSF